MLILINLFSQKLTPTYILLFLQEFGISVTWHTRLPSSPATARQSGRWSVTLIRPPSWPLVPMTSLSGVFSQFSLVLQFAVMVWEAVLSVCAHVFVFFLFLSVAKNLGLGLCKVSYPCCYLASHWVYPGCWHQPSPSRGGELDSGSHQKCLICNSNFIFLAHKE